MCDDLLRETTSCATTCFDPRIESRHTMCTSVLKVQCMHSKCVCTLGTKLSALAAAASVSATGPRQVAT